MGLASGTDIMTGIIEAAQEYISDDDERKKFYKKILKAMKAAMATHGNVTVVTNGDGKHNPTVTLFQSWLSRPNYKYANLVLEYEGPELYHKKSIIIDGEEVMVGSHNLGQKSEQYDDEMNIKIKDRRVAKQAEAAYAVDAQRSRVVKKAEQAYTPTLVGVAARNVIGIFAP